MVMASEGQLLQPTLRFLWSNLTILVNQDQLKLGA